MLYRVCLISLLVSAAVQTKIPPACAQVFELCFESPAATDTFFHFFRPGQAGQDQYRDLEFLFDPRIAPDFTADWETSLQLIAEDIAKNKGVNPFAAQETDIRLVHDFMRPDGAIRYGQFAPSLPESLKFNFMLDSNVQDRDHGHADYYINHPSRVQFGHARSTFCSPTNEDLSTNKSGSTCSAVYHTNSLELPATEVVNAGTTPDPNGTSWAGPNRGLNFGFQHEFQHKLPPAQSSWSSELMSTTAEMIAGLGPRAYWKDEIPYTWSLTGFKSSNPPEDPAVVGLNYFHWRSFGGYVAYNFQGTDTTKSIPNLGQFSGFGDDVVWNWAHTGQSGRLLIHLQNILSNDDSCATCATKTYFQGLSEYDRLQLLHHNYRVANYVNNPGLAEGQYGYPLLTGYSPWQTIPSWQPIDGLAWDDIVCVPPEIMANASWASRETTIVGRRYQVSPTNGQTYSYPMALQPLGSEYWVVKSHAALANAGYKLAIRVTAENVFRESCGTLNSKDGRLMASAVGYEAQTDTLYKHPEWADRELKPKWVDVDSVAGELEFVMPSFADSNKAAVVVITMGDGPSNYFVRWPFGIDTNSYVQALPYRVTFSLAKPPYPPPFTGPEQTSVPLAQIGGSDGTAQRNPTWSPTGNEVAYVWDRRPFNPYQVVVRQAVTDSVRGTVSGYGGHQWDPDWSPRGDWIAFLQDSAGYSHPWIKNIETGQLRQLAFGRIRCVTPVFQPNGQRLAFAMQSLPAPPVSHSGWTLRRVNIDGSGLVSLFSAPPGDLPDDGMLSSVRWDPTGQFVYCVRNDSLLAAPSNGGSLAYRGSVVGGRKVRSFDLPRNNGPILIEEPGQATWAGQCPVDYLRVALVDSTKSPVDVQQRFYRTGALFSGPRWAPDGIRLAYSSTLNESNVHDLFLGMASYNHAPVFNAGVVDKIVTPGQAFSLSLAATDADNDPLSYVGYYLPAGSSVAGSTFNWSDPPANCTDQYAVFRALDPGGGVAQKVVKFTMRPAAVANLSSIAGKTTAVLNWTEPGQGGCQAEKYDIRRSIIQITDANFYSATWIDSSRIPGPEGTPHCLEVSGLSPCTQYYFAIKTRGRGLWSAVSNVPSSTTSCNGFQVFCSEGFMAGGGGGGGSAPSGGLGTASAADITLEGAALPWENSLLWGTLGSEAIDLYKVSAMGNPSGGVYRFDVWTNGTRQAELDELGLGTVDYDPGLAAVAGGDSVFLGVLGPVATATDADGNTLSGPLVLQAGQEVAVQLAAIAPGSALVVESSGAPSRADSVGILVQEMGADSSWTTVATIHPRRAPDSYAVRAAGGETFRLVPQRECTLHSLAQLAIAEAVVPQRLPLVQAEHSRLGAVNEAIATDGGDPAVLFPGDAVILTCNSSEPAPGKTRDVFLLARGALKPIANDAPGDLQPTDSDRSAAVPTWQFALGAARPNPSSGTVRIDYTLARDCEVSIRVYDVAGRLVRTLVGGFQTAGPHEATWDARNDGGARISRGVYFYRMQADDWVSQKKVVLLNQ